MNNPLIYNLKTANCCDNLIVETNFLNRCDKSDVCACLSSALGVILEKVCQDGLWSGERSSWPGESCGAPVDISSSDEIVPFQRVLDFMFFIFLS